jgi:hypothetical protein
MVNRKPHGLLFALGVVTACLFFSEHAVSQHITYTKHGALLCKSKTFLETALQYSKSNDTERYEHMMKAQACIMLAEGIKLAVIEFTYDYAKVQYLDEQLWTHIVYLGPRK